MADTEYTVREKSGKFFSGNVINNDTMQWIAAIPPIVLAFVPFMVFVMRFVDTVYFFPLQILNPLRGVFCVMAGITALCCVYLAIKNKTGVTDIVRGNKPYILFAAFMLMMLISYLVAGVPVYDDPFGYLGIYPNEGHIMYIMFFAVYLFCGSCISSSRIKAVILRSNVIVSFILAVFGLLDFYIVPLTPFRTMDAWWGCMPGVFNNPNHYGYYLTIMTLLSLGMFLYEKKPVWSIFGLASGVIHLVVVVLNDTFGSYLAVWFGIAFLIIANLIIFKKFPLKLLIPVAVFIVGSLFLRTWQGISMIDNFVNLGSDTASIVADSNASQTAGSSRWALWLAAADGISQSPIFGQGVEGWADILLERSNTGIHAHNEYLQYALFFGIPACVFYVGGIIAVFLRGLKNRRKLDGFTLMALAAALGYCASAFFGNPKYYTAPYFFVILGLAYNYCRDEETHLNAANSCDQ